MSSLKIIIMAGGGGTRLWPVSRAGQPKQNLKLVGNGTLLDQTYRRLRKGFQPRDMFVTVGVSDEKKIRRALPAIPADHFSVEPTRRDTAAAIALVAARIEHKYPKAIVGTINSDHFILNDTAYLKTLKATAAAITKRPDYTGVIGVRPTYPETGYGYIQLGRKMGTAAGQPVYAVKRFREKPTLVRAKQFVANRDFVWNSGMFFWRVDHLLGLYRRFTPALHDGIRSIQAAIGTRSYQAVLKQLYPRLEKISVDYALLEKTKTICAIPATFGWTDIGHWRSVKEINAPQATANDIRGSHVGIDTSGSLVYALGKQLVATIGLHDQVVIATDDVVLVCPRDRAQEVKQLLAELQKNKKYSAFL